MRLVNRQYGEGPRALVMLHGLFASKENFHSLARRLEEDFSLWAFDLPNHGDSSHTDTMDYRSMAGDVAETLDQLGIENPVILGHSVGGKVAMEFALGRPDQTAGLVVEDIAPRDYSGTVRRELAALRELPLDRISSRKEAEDWMSEQVGNSAVARFLLKNMVSADEGGYRLRLNIESIHTNYEHLLSFSTAARRYAGPVLFIRGGASNFVTESDESLISEVFPAARIETLPGASHWVHAERTETVARLLREFAAGIE